MKKLLIYITAFFLFTSCKTDVELTINKSYLFLSHTRTDNNKSINKEAESIDYSKYNMLLLGGDLAYTSSDDDSTLSYLDSFFDLGNINTLWSLGNHDNSNLDLIKDYTNRNNYYTHHSDGITFIVLDTQDSFSNIVGDQLLFLNNVMDTIQSSTHLILLHHKLIWMLDNGILESKIKDISNVSIGEEFYALNHNNFYQDIYPKLKLIQSKNIDVICIGGDVGNKTTEFEYITEDGIQFLASGISYYKEGNKALLFHHNTIKNNINWEFKLLPDL